MKVAVYNGDKPDITIKVRPVRYFQLFGEDFAIHRNVAYLEADDAFETGSWYVCSHYGTGRYVGEEHSHYSETVKEAIERGKKYIRKKGKKKLMERINMFENVNPKR